MTRKAKSQAAPMCRICGRTGAGVTFAIFNPRFPPFGTACTDCEEAAAPGATLESWTCARCGTAHRGTQTRSHMKQLPPGTSDVRLGQPLCTTCRPNPSDSDVRCGRCGGVDAHLPDCTA